MKNSSAAPLRWSHGLVFERGQYLYVTSGIGTSLVPWRWRVPPEFVVLEDADGRGGTLIGAATKPNESGIVRWFYRRGSAWYDIGQTDAGEKLFTMVNTGTEPFEVWRGEKSGTVHAAFYALSHVVIEDLQLPPID